MDMDVAVTMVRETLMTALMVSAPILMVGLLIGLLVSIFQAVTQIQEQTLSFVPKILGMAVIAMVLLPWIGTKLMEFAVHMFAP